MLHLKNQLDHFSSSYHISSLEVKQLSMIIFCLPASFVIKTLLCSLVNDPKKNLSQYSIKCYHSALQLFCLAVILPVSEDSIPELSDSLTQKP